MKLTVALDAPVNRASIAACTAAVSAALSGLANEISVVTAVGIVVADASDETATDADAGDRLGVVVNQLPIVDDAPPAEDDAAAAALMADEAAAADTVPCAPAGNVRLTPAVEDPAATSTVAAVAPGNCASIAACTAAESAALSGFANVI